MTSQQDGLAWSISVSSYCLPFHMQPLTDPPWITRAMGTQVRQTGRTKALLFGFCPHPSLLKWEAVPPAQELYTAIKSNPCGKDMPQRKQVLFSLLFRETASIQLFPPALYTGFPLCLKKRMRVYTGSPALRGIFFRRPVPEYCSILYHHRMTMLVFSMWSQGTSTPEC